MPILSKFIVLCKSTVKREIEKNVILQAKALLSFRSRQINVKLEKLSDKFYLAVSSCQKLKRPNIYAALGDMSSKLIVKELMGDVDFSPDEVQKCIQE